jgi:ABC-type bacteriocin/lantibiotic exporter with double-glycine peptidase domain
LQKGLIFFIFKFFFLIIKSFNGIDTIKSFNATKRFIYTNQIKLNKYGRTTFTLRFYFNFIFILFIFIFYRAGALWFSFKLAILSVTLLTVGCFICILLKLLNPNVNYSSNAGLALLQVLKIFFIFKINVNYF